LSKAAEFKCRTEAIDRHLTTHLHERSA